MGVRIEGFKLKHDLEQPPEPPHLHPGDDGNPNWGTRLREHRTKTFVGRAAELELFRQALHAERPAFQVLAVGGPPGSGKTTLLKRFAAECDRLGIGNTLMDARRVPPVPNSFLRVLDRALGLAEDQRYGPALALRGVSSS